MLRAAACRPSVLSIALFDYQIEGCLRYGGVDLLTTWFRRKQVPAVSRVSQDKPLVELVLLPVSVSHQYRHFAAAMHRRDSNSEQQALGCNYYLLQQLANQQHTQPYLTAWDNDALSAGACPKIGRCKDRLSRSRGKRCNDVSEAFRHRRQGIT